MELLRLRRRTALARRGHKLLKDKLDGLIQQIFELAKVQRQLSDELDETLAVVFQQLIFASAQTEPAVLAAATQTSNCQAAVSTAYKNIMGVRVPRYKFDFSGDPIAYNLYVTSGELDQSLINFKNIMAELVRLAEYNKTITVIASEIIEIKRRVNALEYILIPELDNAVKYIRMKLSEMERSNTVTLLKIKDIVRGG
jgi:V/A-type H+-transporting ATPase subunit D